jgi:transposase-like protein
MARHRIYTIEFKRQVAEEHLGGGTSLNRLARPLARRLARAAADPWVKKF